MEVGTQKVSGEGGGEEFKDSNRLRGGKGGSSSSKTKLKKADTPGWPGAHTGTETAGHGERGQGLGGEQTKIRVVERRTCISILQAVQAFYHR